MTDKPDSHVSCPRCLGLGYLTAATATTGDLIASWRKKLDMTQLELASRVGISRVQIANIESGRSDPATSRSPKVCRSLEV